MKNTAKTERTPAEMDVRIFPNRGNGPAAAFAAVTLNGCFAIRDIRIMEGKNGPFVSMPSRKVNGEYRDICFPCTKEFKQRFDQAVLGAYEQTHSQKVQKVSEPQEHQAEQAPQVNQSPAGAVVPPVQPQARCNQNQPVQHVNMLPGQQIT